MSGELDDHDYVADIDVRFRDLDYMKHVNNAVYASYLEHARASYFIDVLGENIDSLDFMVATLEMEYRRPIEYGEKVSVGASVTDIGDTSLTMEYTVVADGETAAEAETVLVAVEDGSSTSVPEGWREIIEGE